MTLTTLLHGWFVNLGLDLATTFKVLCFYVAPFPRYSKIFVEYCNFNLPHLYLAFQFGVTLFEFTKIFGSRTREIPGHMWGVVCAILCLATGRILACEVDGRTDRQRDERTDTWRQHIARQHSVARLNRSWKENLKVFVYSWIVSSVVFLPFWIGLHW